MIFDLDYFTKDIEKENTMKNIRICYIGNPQTIHLQRWINYFINKGHDVHIVTPQPEKIKGATIHEISYNAFYYIQRSFFYKIRIISYILNIFRKYYLIKRTKKIIDNIKPDIIDAHYLSSYGIFASHLDFHPFIITCWGSDVLIDPNKYGEKHVKEMKKTFNRADIISVDGENLKEKTIQYCENPEKIKIMFHGVNTKEFKPINKEICTEKSKFVNDILTVISIRHFESVYDIETLLRSIPLVLKIVSNVKFIIGGRGTQENYLKELAKSLGVLNNIRFTGWVPRLEFPKYLASADIYVSTSLSDSGLAISTVEAMSCGLPVVVTDVSDNKKWINDGVNGFIIPIKNSKLLAEKIVCLLKDKNLRAKFGNINRKIVMEKWEYKTEMEKTEKLYKELIERYINNGYNAKSHK